MSSYASRSRRSASADARSHLKTAIIFSLKEGSLERDKRPAKPETRGNATRFDQPTHTFDQPSSEQWAVAMIMQMASKRYGVNVKSGEAETVCMSALSNGYKR
jgi:hypothetical protein